MRIRDGKWQTLVEVGQFGTDKVLVGIKDDGTVWVFGAPHVLVEMPISTKHGGPMFSNAGIDEPGPRALRVCLDARSHREATVVIGDEATWNEKDSVLDHHWIRIELQKGKKLLKVTPHPPYEAK